MVVIAGACVLALRAVAPTLAAPEAADTPAASTIFLPMVCTAAAPTVAFTSLSDTQLGDQARNPSEPPTLYDVSLLSGPEHKVQKVIPRQDVLVPGWSGDGSFF